MFWERFYLMCLSKGTKPNPVAKEIGVSSGVITKWKNERTLPNSETMLKIATYLDCSVDYLLGLTDNPQGYLNQEYKKPLADSDEGLKDELIRLFDKATPAFRKAALDVLKASAVQSEALDASQSDK